MRQAALLAALAGSAALASPPQYDFEVYYDVTPTSAQPGGVFAGSISRTAFQAGDAAVYDAEKKLHVYDNPIVWTSSIDVMNARQQAFGVAWTGATDLFLTWTPESGFQSPGPLPGIFHGYIEDCNNLGQAVTWGTTENAGTRSFLWTGKAWIDLGSLRADPEDWGSSYPYAINDSGIVVGSSVTDFVNESGGLVTHAFAWRSDTGMVDLGAPAGDLAFSAAYDVNDAGYIVGAAGVEPLGFGHATMWTPQGEMIDLAPDADISVAQVVTENNIVFGQMYPNSVDSAAFMWTAQDGHVDLGSIPGVVFAGFTDANEQGVGVGVGLDANYQVHPIVYVPGEGLIDLNELVPGQYGDLWLNGAIDVQGDGTLVVSGYATKTNGQLGSATVHITPASVCPADLNADGTLDILDFVAFQNAFVNADPAADCDANAELNVLDFVCFQGLFTAGCRQD